MSGITFQNLPRDIHLEIFKLLDLADLAVVSRICKAWKELISTNSFWKSLELKTLFPKLSVIDANVWKKHVDLESFGLSCEGEALIDWHEVIKGLCQMFKSLPIQNDAGITLLTMPQGLKINNLIQLAMSPKHGKKMNFSLKSDDHSNDQIEKTYLMAITNNLLSPEHVIREEITPELKRCIPNVLEACTLNILTNMSSTAPCPPRLYCDLPCSFVQSAKKKDSLLLVGKFQSKGLFAFTTPCSKLCSSTGFVLKFEPVDSKSLSD